MTVLSQETLGFPYRAVPLVLLLGLAFTMASVPQAFTELGDVSEATWAQSAAEILGAAATLIAGALSSPAVTEHLDVLVIASLVATACLVPAAMIRSARAGSWRPLVATGIGLVAGVLAIPAVLWITVALWYLYQLGRWAVGALRAATAWLAELLSPLGPVLGLLLLIGAAAVVLWLAVRAVRSASAGVRLALLGGVLVLGAVLFTGQLVEILRSVGAVLAGISGWLGEWLPVLAGWLITAMLACAILGVVVALLGTVGRTVVLTVESAWDACRDFQRSSDLAAGVGLTLGVMLLAAATQTGRGEFGPWLSDLVGQTSGLGWVSPLLGATAALLPAQAEPQVETFLDGYSVTLDAALMLVAAMIGILSLTTRSLAWAQDGDNPHRTLQPSMIAAGLAIAMAIPLTVLALWARAQSES